MSTYKSEHTGERVDNAVTKIPEGLPTEDSFIVVKANGSASEYVPQPHIENGTGTKSVEQVINNGTTTTIPISTKNPNAVSLGAPTSVNVGAVGESASSFGGASNATGKRSHSEGTNTVAIGKYSHAEGDNSVALGNDSHAEGITTVAKGQASHSEGSATQSIGYSSHAEGIKTITEGNYSHSEGNETIAHGSASHSEGTLSTANGDNSHAEGRSTHSNGTNSHSEGYETTASGIASHAEGIETNANAYASHTEGEKTVVETQLPSSSSGSGSGGSSGGSTGNPDDPSWNIGEHLGEKSHAEGTGNTVYGYSAHAEGFKTTAFGHISHTEGTKTQTGENANGSINGGYSAHAEGTETKAIGYASHAEGVRTEAQGNGSHSEGYGTTASGEYAHTEGTSNTASGTNSHTEGRDTRASGENSHAEGFGTRATHDNQHVGGQFNADNGNALFIIGNGTSDTDRKNAFEVLKDGRAKVQTAPQDSDDVVRKLELDTKLDKAGGTISGSLIIADNLTVQGKTTSVDTQNLKVADKLIYVAKDNTVALTSPAGLITPKYDGTNNGGIVYDNTGTAYVGDISLDSNGNVDVNSSDLQPIATRNATITDGNIVKWNNAAKKLVDSGKAIDDLSTATNLENGSGDHSIVQKVIPSSTSDPNNYATGKEAVSLGRYSITKADRAMTVNYDNKNYGKWSFVANKSNRVGSENGNQDDVQSNAVFGEGNIIEKGIEGFVSGKSNINYEGDRFNLSGSENKNHTNLTRMSGWKNESLEELKTAIPSGGGGTPPDVPPVEPTNPFDYTSVLGYNDISGNENKVFAMGASTRGVAGVCYSPFGSTEGFWTKAGYIVEKERKDGYIYYKPQGLGAKAFGAGTWAKEDYTVAGGQQTQALKKGSIALGLGTIAKSEWSTMIGKYNVGYSDSVFEVGNGFSANDRSNLLTLYSDGRLVNKDGKAFITDINKTDWAHEGAADAGKILMLDSTGNLLLTNADNPTLSSHLVNKKFVQEYVAEHGSDNLNIENGTGNALVQTTDSNHSFKVMADGRAKVQTAPVDTDDVVRKLELDNLNARYVSTSILGG